MWLQGPDVFDVVGDVVGDREFLGLKAGILCAGISIAVFLEMFLPVFAALVLMIKDPNPLRYTFSPPYIEVLISCMKDSIIF